MAVIFVDNVEIDAEEGRTLLEVCLEKGIAIPNLCFIKHNDSPSASCRLCFVEIEGIEEPVTSCTVKVKDGMVVTTDSAEVRELQKTAFRLILSTHRIDCGNCPSRKRCELIKISRILKVKLSPEIYDPIERKVKAEEHPHLIYDISKCINCGKCVYICKKLHGRSYITFARRGIETGISFFGEKDAESIPCGKCRACADICPVSALLFYEHYSDLLKKQ